MKFNPFDRKWFTRDVISPAKPLGVHQIRNRKSYTKDDDGDDGDGQVARLQTANAALVEQVAAQADEIAGLKAEIARLKGDPMPTADSSGLRGMNARSSELIRQHQERCRQHYGRR